MPDLNKYGTISILSIQRGSSIRLTGSSQRVNFEMLGSAQYPSFALDDTISKLLLIVQLLESQRRDISANIAQKERLSYNSQLARPAKKTYHGLGILSATGYAKKSIERLGDAVSMDTASLSTDQQLELGEY